MVTASLDMDSAEHPARTCVRQECERCPASKWQIKEPSYLTISFSIN
jgi:hypothetical protein